MLRSMILAAFVVAPLAPALAQSADEQTVAVTPAPVETAAPAATATAPVTPVATQSSAPHAEGKSGCGWMRTAELPVS